jgi:MYXO-CTERM domain-containing protein
VIFDPYVRSLRLATVAWAVFLAAALVGMSAGPAASHAQLVSSTPADRATIREAPNQVTLEFSGKIIPDSASVTAAGPEGEQELAATGSGTTVTARWPTAWRVGDFQVNYRVASSDGHIMTGATRFTVAAAPGNTSTATAVPENTPTPDSDQAAVETSTTGGDNAPGSVPTWLLAVIGLAALGLLLWWLLNRRREQADD